MTTENPAIPPEESVPVRCTRCGEVLRTVLQEWRHREEHIDADRAMLRPRAPKPPTRESKFSPLSWAVIL